jgi:hypothetical protein
LFWSFNGFLLIFNFSATTSAFGVVTPDINAEISSPVSHIIAKKKRNQQGADSLEFDVIKHQN